MKNNYHESVLVDKAIEGLHIKNAANYIDATLGNGGHALAILNQKGCVLGIDLDSKMIEISERRLNEAYPVMNQSVHGRHFKLVNGNFTEIDKIAKEQKWLPVSGILFDLGVSNIHLKDLERGFSFENPEAPLDMRINTETQAVKASDLLNVLREDQLRNLFEVTLDPGAAKWISNRVIFSRSQKPIKNVGDLIEICTGLKTGKISLNSATLPFLALRIAVNSELDNLIEVLPKAFDLLEKEGRLVVISFHSKEDEIVKNFMKDMSDLERGKQITFKPVTAQGQEINENRRSRSAKLRIIEKI